MTRAQARICPTCGTPLAPVPDKPDSGTCERHGEFRFIDRLTLDDGIGAH